MPRSSASSQLATMPTGLVKALKRTRATGSHPHTVRNRYQVASPMKMLFQKERDRLHAEPQGRSPAYAHCVGARCSHMFIAIDSIAELWISCPNPALIVRVPSTPGVAVKVPIAAELFAW